MVGTDFDLTKVSGVKQKKNYNFVFLPQNIILLFSFLYNKIKIFIIINQYFTTKYSVIIFIIFIIPQKKSLPTAR
jgi:hypothetical protein